MGFLRKYVLLEPLAHGMPTSLPCSHQAGHLSPHQWAAMGKLVPEEMLPTSAQPHLSGGVSADLLSSSPTV